MEATIEEGMILQDGTRIDPEARRYTSQRRVLTEEMKRILFIAGPMVAVTLFDYMLDAISIIMVGHLDKLSLSSTTIAISLASVTGFSIMMGMSSALETLCGHAFGAKEYQKLGTETYTAIFTLLCVCAPVSILWAYIGSLLVLIGQDPLISHKAGKFITCLIPSLFANAIIQPLVRYFLMQSMLLPMFLSSTLALCIHIPLCWVLVYKTGMGNIGAAMSTGVAMWSHAIFLLFYMKYSASCTETRSSVTVDVFRGMKHYLRFAIPSTGMICLELWFYEIIILLSGLLPNPELETSVLSICVNTIIILYALPYGLAAGVSTRISNELGAANPQGARVAVKAVMILVFVETSISSMVIFLNRHTFGFIFTNEKEVVDYVTKIAPILCINIIMDSIHGALSGVARGAGWQNLGAYANLVAFYLVGIPVATSLGFCTSLGGEGLWIGILIAAIVQVILLAIITIRTDYEKQATKTRERLSVI